MFDYFFVDIFLLNDSLNHYNINCPAFLHFSVSSSTSGYEGTVLQRAKSEGVGRAAPGGKGVAWLFG